MMYPCIFSQQKHTDSIIHLLYFSSSQHALYAFLFSSWCCLINSPLMTYQWECLNKPIFSNLELCSVHWAHIMCHHGLWPTSLSHPFSYLSSSLGLAGEEHYKKNTIPFLILVLQNCAFPSCFLYILFYHHLFSIHSSGWFVHDCIMWLYFSHGSDR